MVRVCCFQHENLGKGCKETAVLQGKLFLADTYLLWWSQWGMGREEGPDWGVLDIPPGEKGTLAIGAKV